MGRAPLGAPGQPNYGNEMMRLVSMMNQARLDKEKAAYYGAEKESTIEKRQQDIATKQEAQIGKEAGEEFSGETGLAFDPKKDEPYVASLRAAKRAELPPAARPVRREPENLPGLVKKWFSPPEAQAPTGEDPDIAAGRMMGIKAAMKPQLYEEAQKEVQARGYSDPTSQLYSPETVRAAGTRTMRPEDVSKFAQETSIQREHAGKARKETAEAGIKEMGLSREQRIARYAQAYSETPDKKQRDELIRRVAIENGHVGDIAKLDEDKRKGYLDATNKASEATTKLVEAQVKYPDKIDLHAGLAREASVANLAAAELENAPMTDLITAMPYNSKNPFSGQYTKSNRVKVPTDFAKADRDGVIEGIIRAPLNPKDPDDAQIAQMNKQGAYLAWKIIQQNPEYLGNPTAFEAAIDKNEAIAAYLKPIAKHHMGLYMQMNEDTRSEVDKGEARKVGVGQVPSSLEIAEKYGIPGSAQSLIPAEETRQGIRNVLEGTVNKVKDFANVGPALDKIRGVEGEEPARSEVPREPTARGGSVLEEPPTAPKQPTQLPTIKGVPKSEAVGTPPAPQTQPGKTTDDLAPYTVSSKTIRDFIGSGKSIKSPAEAANFGEWLSEIFRRREAKTGARLDIEKEIRGMKQEEFETLKAFYRSKGGK